MLAFAHVILHVALCAAAARASGDSIPLHLTLAYRTGSPPLDKTFNAERGSHGDATIEFDIDRGLYRMLLVAPTAGCSATDFLDFLADHPRTIAETLVAGPPPEPKPVTLFEGSSPQSFLYIRPTFVVFDKSQACDQPIGTPLNVNIVTEYDPEGFYVWMYPDATLDPAGTVIAARVRTPTGLYHFIRLPVPFPTTWRGWPNDEHIDLTDDDIASIATDKTGVLLCPKIYQTSAG